MKTTLILASQSPRRSELLRSIGLDFKVEPAVHFKEIDSRSCSAHEAVKLNAEGKATEIAKNHPNDLVLGVDTVGAFQDLVLEKPKDKDDAFAMLKMLQGETHEVLTGLCLIKGKKKISHIESTRISFLPLTDEEIRAYIETGEPMDKAASYAAQGIGALFIQKIEGDYFTVVGLPLYRLNIMLKEFDINLLTD
ncbi:MAG: Maf family protein [Candidatus Gracilibacteria bacterium]|jgi:septum formation protein